MRAIQVIIQYIKLFCILFKHWFFDLIDLFQNKPLKDLSLETVLITGAASGLGKGVAQRLAHLGATLILWDVDEANNARVAEELNNATKSKRIHAMKCDLTNRESIYECARKVNDVHLKNIHAY
jgi:all-trans-retinol dehydrogenase (NAD+)